MNGRSDLSHRGAVMLNRTVLGGPLLDGFGISAFLGIAFPVPRINSTFGRRGALQMSRTHREREEAYSVLRYDAFHGAGRPPEVVVTVKQVVRSRELAEAEVARLNGLDGDKGVRYWWQVTRLFPEGHSAGTQEADQRGEPDSGGI
jgi:hypothetical protein